VGALDYGLMSRLQVFTGATGRQVFPEVTGGGLLRGGGRAKSGGALAVAGTLLGRRRPDSWIWDSACVVARCEVKATQWQNFCKYVQSIREVQ
jgi:hypothetical protein